MSFSSDVPRREPRRRLGRLKARRTAHLYQVDFGRGSEWAYYPGDDLLTLGTDRTAVFDPASDQWWIRPFGGGFDVFTATLRSFGADPFIMAYPWTPGAGFGAQYADPGNAGNTNEIMGFASSTSDLVAAIDSVSPGPGTPNIAAYPWTPGVGLGAQYADPATFAGNAANGIAFTGTDVAIATTGSPKVVAYPFASGSGFGTKYANPATLPAGATAYSAAFQGTSTLVVGHLDTPFVSAYPWTAGAGFGAKYANPGTLPTGAGYGVAFSESGADVIVSHETTPFVTAYPWTDGGGFGAKYANPASLPNAAGNAVAFQGSAEVAIADAFPSPVIAAYPWTPGSGFGTKYADPATAPANTDAYGVDFAGSGDIIIAAFTAGFVWPFIAYSWTPGAGFGTKYTDPSTPSPSPTETGQSVHFAAF